MEKTLYQKNQLGKIKSWKIKVEKGLNSSNIIVETGLLDGKKITHIETIKEGKNIGKANATDHYTQALAEAKSNIESKIDGGYVEDIHNVKESHIMGNGMPEVMKANKFDPSLKQKGSKNFDKLKVKNDEIVCIQRKLDGNRCLIYVDRNKIEMWSRGGKTFIIPHIIKQIREAFDRIVDEKIPDEYIWLDGELYCDPLLLSFNKLNGILKKKHFDLEDHDKLKKVSFNMYDTISDESYEIREKILFDFENGKDLHKVESFYINADEKLIEKYHLQFLEQGYEGLMIRILNKPYQHKRTWDLLKCKLFEDDEFEIVGAEESDKRPGMLKRFVCRIKNPITVEGKTYDTINPPMNGTFEELEEYWVNRENYIGKMLTVEYFGFSEFGVPRHPKGKGFKSDFVEEKED